MGKKASKMYGDSPKMERDGKSGKMGVSEKKKPKADNTAAGTEGVEGMDHEVRHGMERRDLHNRHETEHAVSKGDKKEMHGRHQADLKALHKKHEKELGTTEGEKEKPAKKETKSEKKESE